MPWYKRDLEPHEDYGETFSLFERMFMSLKGPRGMMLGIDQKPGEAGALYAALPTSGLAPALGFTPCSDPTAGTGLIGHQDQLLEVWPVPERGGF